MNSDPEEYESLYNIAKTEIQRLIKIYLRLVENTNNLDNVTVKSLSSPETIVILLAGIGSNLDPRKADPIRAVKEWERRRAIPFDIETSVTTGVYFKLREISEIYWDELTKETKNFSKIDSEYIKNNPQYLPFLQHVCGIFSKSKLKEIVGSVNDVQISAPAAKRLAECISERVDPRNIRKGEILTRLGGTLEGIVRDLVGRILLESVVANALEAEGLPFEREEEYETLKGVVYDFRADFVLPNSKKPRVFIEVRKSSSRHASLYAKDKMFSAINWKGENRDLLGVLVVDGQWTSATLNIMSKVFDYVIPISGSPKLAKILSAYISGDRSRLKWLIDFRISENPEAI